MNDESKYRKYNASRGGHAPDRLRHAFSEFVDEWLLEEPAALLSDAGRELTGKLWNCIDIMPRDLCQDLELAQGSSYAVGARKVRNHA